MNKVKIEIWRIFSNLWNDKWGVGNNFVDDFESTLDADYVKYVIHIGFIYDRCVCFTADA